MKMILIGITGKKRSGKDTLARCFRAQFERTERVAFADPVKQLVATIFGVTVERLDQTKDIYFPHVKCSPREMMRTFAEDCGRNRISQNIWITPVKNAILTAHHHRNCELVVVADVRRENEARAIKDLGGSIVYIERPGGEKDSHVSEMGIPAHLVDYSVFNGGNIQLLFEASVRIVETIKDQEKAK